ncbi:DNA polymerase III subunit psi [Legionella fallonii]|uniref:Uncharacterized protein n=1 Tax=Legionella fallonii LLAP-10 TaxID=1212491 RepID=A0A098G5M6_9GAMM|nr:DNA polymerase III subunit psi [Legionella fallonii]CEG56795.1 protein of unknown function [Legionella fallonii LLAP-10]
MYSNLTLYYLNQIGITPWVNKELIPNLIDQPNETSTHPIIVLISTELSDKMRSLFNQMMDYIDITQDEVLVVAVREQELENKLLDKAPQALLSLGPNVNDLNLPYPIFQGLALEYLLDNPLSKREVFQVLTRLRAYLQISS